MRVVSEVLTKAQSGRFGALGSITIGMTHFIGVGLILSSSDWGVPNSSDQPNWLVPIDDNTLDRSRSVGHFPEPLQESITGLSART